MKKTLRLLLALILMISLTGCVKYNVNMEVKDDKSVTLEIIYGMEVDSSFMEDEDSWSDEDDNYYDEEDDSWSDEDDSLSEEDDMWDDEDNAWSDEDDNYYDDEDDSWSDEDEDYWDEEESDSAVNVEDYSFLESKGFKVEEFTEEKDDTTISGVKITKTYKNIDDITKDKKIIVNFNERFDSQDNFDDSQYFYKKGNKYVANFVFDFSEESDDTDYSAYQDMFDLEYKIKLPSKAKSHNATKVSDDGKELTWDLKYGEKNEVNFEFSLGGINTMLIIILAVAGIAVVGVVVAVVMISKKKKKNNQTPTNTPQNPNQNNYNPNMYSQNIQNPNYPNNNSTNM